MSDKHNENSITEKMRQVRPPAAPIKQVERISLEAYKQAIRPATRESSAGVKLDLSKLYAKK